MKFIYESSNGNPLIPVHLDPLCVRCELPRAWLGFVQARACGPHSFLCWRCRANIRRYFEAVSFGLNQFDPYGYFTVGMRDVTSSCVPREARGT
jgi:hypothetical protein